MTDVKQASQEIVLLICSCTYSCKYSCTYLDDMDVVVLSEFSTEKNIEHQFKGILEHCDTNLWQFT